MHVLVQVCLHHLFNIIIQISADNSGLPVPALSFHDVTVPLDHMIGDVGEATALAELNNRKLSELFENDGTLS